MDRDTLPGEIGFLAILKSGIQRGPDIRHALGMDLNAFDVLVGSLLQQHKIAMWMQTEFDDIDTPTVELAIRMFRRY